MDYILAANIFIWIGLFVYLIFLQSRYLKLKKKVDSLIKYSNRESAGNAKK